FPIAKPLITHGMRSFSNEAPVPVSGIKPVPDLKVFDPVLRVIKETAVTDDRVFAARDDRKLRWNAGAIPAHNFLDKSDRLFPFGENAQRKAHEIRIRE